MTERNMKINLPEGDPYSPLLENFFFQQFPVASLTKTETVLDAVVNELIGTGQYRHGPRPNPESLVAIREVARWHISKDQPIPLLIPFGGMKTDRFNSVDIAELATLKTLNCVNRGVMQYYPPGLQANIRIEDVGAKYLFREMSADYSIDVYSEDFAKLIRIVSGDWVKPVKESDMFTYSEYADTSDSLVPDFREYVLQTDLYGFSDERQAEFEQRTGWRGEIPIPQRDYYRGRYARLYPGQTADYYTNLLAEYFAGALARYTLGARGDDPNWSGKFLDLRFVPNVPGAPAALVSRVLSYRAIPQKYTRDHVTPWRGKGYLRVHGNTATPAITSWKDERVYNPYKVIFSNENASVSVQADYVVMD